MTKRSRSAARASFAAACACLAVSCAMATPGLNGGGVVSFASAPRCGRGGARRTSARICASVLKTPPPPTRMSAGAAPELNSGSGSSGSSDRTAMATPSNAARQRWPRVE
eukprot:1592461-Pleurochrysis_carterae.AAC.2